MLTRHSFGRFGKAPSLVLMIGAMGTAYVAIAIAQADAPVQLPNGPAKSGFDIARFSDNGGIFKTFNVQQTEPLQKVVEEGRVAGDTPVLVTETAAGKLALLTDQMVFHHLAQGRAGGKDWLAAF